MSASGTNVMFSNQSYSAYYFIICQHQVLMSRFQISHIPTIIFIICHITYIFPKQHMSNLNEIMIYISDSHYHVPLLE